MKNYADVAPPLPACSPGRESMICAWAEGSSVSLPVLPRLAPVRLPLFLHCHHHPRILGCATSVGAVLWPASSSWHLRRCRKSCSFFPHERASDWFPCLYHLLVVSSCEGTHIIGSCIMRHIRDSHETYFRLMRKSVFGFMRRLMRFPWDSHEALLYYWSNQNLVRLSRDSHETLVSVMITRDRGGWRRRCVLSSFYVLCHLIQQ